MATGRKDSWTADEIIVAAEILSRNGWRDLRETDPAVHELSSLLRSLPAHHDQAAHDPKFRSPGSVRHKLTDLRTAHPDYSGTPTRGGEITRQVAEAFVTTPDDMAAIARTTRREWERIVAEGAPPASPGDVDVHAEEGRAVVVRHLRRERDPKLRARKIDAVLRQHGALSCEVCEFDFGAAYGEVGEGYIEVHHVVPLHASGETTTRLADLALLCSNCHRMIHRRVPWLTPDELRSKVHRAV